MSSRVPISKLASAELTQRQALCRRESRVAENYERKRLGAPPRVFCDAAIIRSELSGVASPPKAGTSRAPADVIGEPPHATANFDFAFQPGPRLLCLDSRSVADCDHSSGANVSPVQGERTEKMVPRLVR